MFSINLVISALIAALLSYLLTPLTVPLCERIGAFDIPDGKRKINEVAIPRLGGLAFFLASAITLLPLVPTSPTVAALLSSGAILVAGGVADDSFSAPAIQKLFIQTAAALVAISFIGIPSDFSFFGIFRIPLDGWVGFLFVLFRLIFTVNAVNFSDGLDGLASGLSAVALFSLSVYGSINGKAAPSAAALILALAVIGFIPYNKYRARVFMGDAGSQFLGLSVALLSLGNSPSGSYTIETSLFLAVPAVDTALSVIRRVLHGKSPFAADKGHLHHILLKLGISHPDAVKLLIALSATVAAIALRFLL
jgi:UDP-GlcNAc:undecaprenyl-phosphate GlcNAc-1-phosphate transferase